MILYDHPLSSSAQEMADTLHQAAAGIPPHCRTG